MAKFKIHFTDAYGTATITCETYNEYLETLSNLRNDPIAEDIWCEEYDDEEGWQAL